MDLHHLTSRALDWGVLTSALAGHARTVRGHREALELQLADSIVEVERRFQTVSEVWLVESEGERIPLSGLGDPQDLIDQAARGVVLELEGLMQVRNGTIVLDRLKKWLEARAEKVPALVEIVQAIYVCPELLSELDAAFDDAGELCGHYWTHLGHLRTQLRRLRESVRWTLDQVLRSPQMDGILQDHYITEREGRFVLPVRAGAPRKGLGIVHGTSQSGETLFVEPAEVVAKSNEIRETESAIQREIRRILVLLSGKIGGQATPLQEGLKAATSVDLAVARAGLGQCWNGCIPSCGDEGEVLLLEARHPVLVLRGIDVVPNDLRLNRAQPALVLSGPNTGGKTVALKTVGLCAMLVRAGIPLPVDEGSRMDFMDPVLADIGDVQTVEGDLSTFSGHLLVLNQILDGAKPGALVLLDEVGMGTDPGQGAALAQAFLEALVDQGVRLVVTTHYAPLRALGAVDNRFGLAAVEVEEGRPTYRVLEGQAGASHAFAIASGLQTPTPIIERARALMDQSSRQLTEMVELLENQRGENAAERRSILQERADLQEAAEKHRKATRRLAARREQLEQQLVADFERRLLAQETRVKRLIAALQNDPSMQDAGKVLDEVRRVRHQVQESKPPEPPPQEERPLPDILAVGDPVWVNALKCEARILSVDSRGRIEVQVGGARMKVKRRDLSGVARSIPENGHHPYRCQSKRCRRWFPCERMGIPAIYEAVAWMRPLRRRSNIVTRCYEMATILFLYCTAMAQVC